MARLEIENIQKAASWALMTQPLKLYKNGSGDMQTARRGDIFYADLSPVVGSEQGGIRPILIIQNNTGNKHSPTVICAAITSQIKRAKLPTHIVIDNATSNLVKDSIILLEQIRTIDKSRLREKIYWLDEKLMRRVDKAIMISIGLVNEQG